MPSPAPTSRFILVGLALMMLAVSSVAVTAFVPQRIDPAFYPNDILTNASVGLVDHLAGPPATQVYVGSLLLGAVLMLAGFLFLKLGDRAEARMRYTSAVRA